MSQSQSQFVVPSDQAGEKLDRLVARAAGVSRRVARTWIATGRVQVNRRVVRILTKPVAAGATIVVTPEAPAEPVRPSHRSVVTAPAGEHAPVRILYLDRWMVAVAKPPRLLSEHDRFGSPSLESEVPKLLAARGEHTRLWLVHRLDAGTSGVMVMARTPGSAAALGDAFREGTVQKTYLALCTGVLGEAVDVDAPIGKAERTRHQVRRDGKPAQTRFVPVAGAARASLVEASPRTGRTHQIRVHLAHLGHPILGDRLYGGPGYTEAAPPESIPRPMLHARRLELPHPKEPRRVVFEVAVPEDFAAVGAAFGIPVAP
jgi:23S rRNA pseudouridine1911/1915/1917 synthase